MPHEWVETPFNTAFIQFDPILRKWKCKKCGKSVTIRLGKYPLPEDKVFVQEGPLPHSMTCEEYIAWQVQNT